MQRIYIKELEKDNEILTIEDSGILNQLLKVLRSKIGDKIIFFNGKNYIDFEYEIVSIEKRKIFLKKIGKTSLNNEIDFNLNLYQAIPNKLEKIEYILQKGTEIGITNFFFFNSERSSKINLSENKIERFNKIVIEASEQSGRNVIPSLNFLEEIDFKELENSNNLFFHTEDNDSKLLKNLGLNYKKDINIFVGPEGGFSLKEIEKFGHNKFEKIYLDRRILRTETTGIVAGFYIIQNK